MSGHTFLLWATAVQFLIYSCYPYSATGGLQPTISSRCLDDQAWEGSWQYFWDSTCCMSDSWHRPKLPPAQSVPISGGPSRVEHSNWQSLGSAMWKRIGRSNHKSHDLLVLGLGTAAALQESCIGISINVYVLQSYTPPSNACLTCSVSSCAPGYNFLTHYHCLYCNVTVICIINEEEEN